MTSDPIVTFEVEDTLQAVITCPQTGADTVHQISLADIFHDEISARLITCLDGNERLYEEDKQELLEMLNQLEEQIWDAKNYLLKYKFTISKTTPLNPG